MNAQPMKHAPDLRKALDQLPKPDGVPRIQVRVELSPEEGAAVPDASAMVVEFQRGVLATPEGSEPVWVFEGRLELDPAMGDDRRDPEAVAAWLREQLGPRCLAVDVGEVAGRGVNVRVAATVGAAHRPD